MTIKKRLAVSNMLMILLPVAFTLLIAAGCIGIIWFGISQGTGLSFEDSQSFDKSSSDISEMAEKTLSSRGGKDRSGSLGKLNDSLSKGGMSMVVIADGAVVYRYGSANDPKLETAALALGTDGTVTSGKDSVYIRTVSEGGVNYKILLYGEQRKLTYFNLKKAASAAGVVLLAAIILSVFFTNRFLTRFVFRHIERPLELLSGGVRQISEGNLEYRLEYHEKDEFSPVFDDFNDMAERLKQSVERSRREEESRRELMAGISHDLRSPLTAIQAYVEGLLDGVAATPAAQRKYLLTIKARAEELERMVERILTYSRMELEEAPRNAVPLRLDEYIRTEIASVSADYSGRGLDISSQLEPCTVTADPEELRQILLNIADNSLKYRVRDRASLAVRLKAGAESCELSFTDNGPGVPQEILPKLFDEFYRADKARSDRTKGSGLGLAIVAKAAKRMGGSVRAELPPGSGLAVILTIPKGGLGDAENTDNRG
jgi:signal transduction histidine kinase